ncbi:PC-Esterase [Cynara cardunculus var. scolymus]|uniref:PC-Esterase n=1 Tax=Cynara cardunculus var. scolymus TaxID=59895 RepID=A0A103XMY7_CYNCS|nr:PC-Esterase [Cynara cardunculus var. scolymus]
MVKNPSQPDLDSTNYMGTLKKSKHFKLFEPSLGILGFLFITVCIIFGFFYLDYRSVITGGVFRFSNETQRVKWLKFGGYPNGNRFDFLSVDGDGCDVFDGDWVWDEKYPLYESKNCRFLDEGFRCSENGRPDFLYTKWRWQPKECNLPRFDGKRMLEKLRDKRIVFVGDSIGRNQWESLLCMLSSTIISSKDNGSIYEVNGNPITKHKGFLVFKFRDYNCTLEYYRAPFLVLQSRPPPHSPPNIRTTLKLDQMDWTSVNWQHADVVTSKKEHKSRWRWKGGNWRAGGNCHLETLPNLRSSRLQPSFGWPQYRIFRNVVSDRSKNVSNDGKKAFDILYTTSMSSRRKDGHPSLYYLGPKLSPAAAHRQDCSHWCLPGVPDAWNEILYALMLKNAPGTNDSSNSHSPALW